jgi:hypothetical protein
VKIYWRLQAIKERTVPLRKTLAYRCLPGGSAHEFPESELVPKDSPGRGAYELGLSMVINQLLQ